MKQELIRGSQLPLETSNFPIFIVGVPRSGTTLLRLILTSHSDICIPPESTFFLDLENRYGKSTDLSQKIDDFIEEIYQDNKFQDWQVDQNKLRQKLSAIKPLTYAQAVATVYRSYLEQKKPNAKIWGDKNPFYYYQVDKILKYFPQARFVNIIRDVRAIYSSIKKVSKLSSWIIDSPASYVTEKWTDNAKFVEEHSANDIIYHIHYENLILDPELSIRQLCDWLGIKFESKMLEFYQENLDKKLVPRDRLSWHYNTLKPIKAELANSWKDELSIEELINIEFLNRKNMKIMGYKSHQSWSVMIFLKVLIVVKQFCKKLIIS